MNMKIDGMVTHMAISATLVIFIITAIFTITHADAIIDRSKLVKTANPGNFVANDPGKFVEADDPGVGEPDVIEANCVHGSVEYSKGAVVKMDDGSSYRCTGDKDGTWKKVATKTKPPTTNPG